MKLPDEIREFFRKQGKIGAKKRLKTLSPERRREIAQAAANARWAKQGQEQLSDVQTDKAGRRKSK
jgi:hypothetical protein